MGWSTLSISHGTRQRKRTVRVQIVGEVIWKGKRQELVGIDVGSSSVKVAAYSVEGKLIALASQDLTPLYPAPGMWETDPEDIWQATSAAMRQLTLHPAVRKDPPQVIAGSASGRENFPPMPRGIRWAMA